MKMKTTNKILFLVLVFSLNHIFSYSQTNLKANLATALIGIPNFGVETKIGNKLTFQLDVNASFWKSIKNGPFEFVMVIPEVRYYTNKINHGFFIGAHIGGSTFKLQKWSYVELGKYQKGYNVLFGVTLGYLFIVNERFNLELFAGGGSQQAFYKGYDLNTGERYDGAMNYNKSGELIPYRGGLMLVYKLK
jgi:hypothetical protein